MDGHTSVHMDSEMGLGNGPRSSKLQALLKKNKKNNEDSFVQINIWIELMKSCLLGVPGPLRQRRFTVKAAPIILVKKKVNLHKPQDKKGPHGNRLRSPVEPCCCLVDFPPLRLGSWNRSGAAALCIHMCLCLYKL